MQQLHSQWRSCPSGSGMPPLASTTALAAGPCRLPVQGQWACTQGAHGLFSAIQVTRKRAGPQLARAPACMHWLARQGSYVNVHCSPVHLSFCNRLACRATQAARQAAWHSVPQQLAPTFQQRSLGSSHASNLCVQLWHGKLAATPLTTPLPWGSLVSLPPLKVNSPAQLVLGLFPGLRVLRAACEQWLAVRAGRPAGQQLRGQGPPGVALVRRWTHTSSPQKPPFQLLVTLSSPSTVAA